MCRPVILPDYAEVELRVPEDARCGAWVCFDGKRRQELFRGDAVGVRMSTNPLPTVSRTDQTRQASCAHKLQGYRPGRGRTAAPTCACKQNQPGRICRLQDLAQLCARAAMPDALAWLLSSASTQSATATLQQAHTCMTQGLVCLAGALLLVERQDGAEGVRQLRHSACSRRWIQLGEQMQPAPCRPQHCSTVLQQQQSCSGSGISLTRAISIAVCAKASQGCSSRTPTVRQDLPSSIGAVPGGTQSLTWAISKPPILAPDAARICCSCLLFCQS